MTTSNRIAWLDASKGIGIFLVILGHTTIVGSPRALIYSFHMPLFFFISGFLFSAKGSFKEFSIIKMKSLLIPYFVFAGITILISYFYMHQPIDVKNFILSTIESKRNSIYFNAPLWFLTSLFTIEILFYFIVKFIKNKYAILLFVFIIGFISFGIFKPTTGANILPWSLDQSLYYLVFFCLGYFIKINGWFNRDLKKSIILITSSIIYVWFVIDPSLYNKFWQLMNLPPNAYFYFNSIIWASLSISFVIYISQFLSISPLINYMGKNSLILMALHTSLAFVVFNKHFRADLVLENHPNVLALLLTVFSIALLLPVSLIINKFFPFILGKKFRLQFPAIKPNVFKIEG
jgi:acyltransferase